MSPKLLLLLLLIFQGCDITAEDGLATPIDEYCFPGLCNTDQICVNGQCYNPCKTNKDCNSQCCMYATDGKTYCVPNDWC